MKAIDCPLGYKSRAARDRVSISNTKNTYWFGEYDGARLVGFGALYSMGKNRVRVKGVWVEPDCRGTGLGEKIHDALFMMAVDCLHASVVEAFAYNCDFYAKKGYLATGTLPNGAFKMRKIV